MLTVDFPLAGDAPWHSDATPSMLDNSTPLVCLRVNDCVYPCVGAKFSSLVLKLLLRRSCWAHQGDLGFVNLHYMYQGSLAFLRRLCRTYY
jgi:hypothetical protein